LAADAERERRLGVGDRLPDPTEATIVRFEEEAEPRPSGWRGVGFIRARKQIETATVDESILRRSEDVELDRIPAADDDRGDVQTLPDGGISIPIYEERLVVRKEVVLKERLVIRKRIVAEHERVETELRREHVEVDVDDAIADRVAQFEDNAAKTDETRRNER